jgi:hypothetical protein
MSTPSKPNVFLKLTASGVIGFSKGIRTPVRYDQEELPHHNS